MSRTASVPKPTQNSALITHHSYKMSDDLIYRLTKAVYGRLGNAADEQTVEQLVTEIYREVEPFVNVNGRSLNQANFSRSSTGAPESIGSSDRMVISVFGLDHPGIVAGVAQILAEADCSIVDINQTVVRGKFAMVIIANITQAGQSATDLKDRLRSEGEKLGVHIYAQREDLFNAMHRV
jgi:ACT domain-containing protein